MMARIRMEQAQNNSGPKAHTSSVRHGGGSVMAACGVGTLVFTDEVSRVNSRCSETSVSRRTITETKKENKN